MAGIGYRVMPGRDARASVVIAPRPPNCMTDSTSSGFCHVCGGHAFEHTPVLWPELVTTWGLSPEEAEYIDIQQGTHCLGCGSNVRSIALARAILRWRQHQGPLIRFVQDDATATLRVLEINEAGTLHPVLRLLPGHRIASYPAVDMTHLPFGDGSFDLVVHSDTLEHVPDPARGSAGVLSRSRRGGSARADCADGAGASDTKPGRSAAELPRCRPRRRSAHARAHRVRRRPVGGRSGRRIFEL